MLIVTRHLSFALGIGCIFKSLKFWIKILKVFVPNLPDMIAFVGKAKVTI